MTQRDNGFDMRSGRDSVSEPLQQLTFVHLLVLAAVVFLSAMISLYISRIEGSIALLWLPNAIVLAHLWNARPANQAMSILPLAIGIIAANYIYGDPITVATGLGLANSFEVALGYCAINYFLHGEQPLSSHRRYLEFLLGLCILPVLIAAALGASVISLSYGAVWQQVYLSWVLGDVCSLLAIVPLALTLEALWNKGNFRRVVFQDIAIPAIATISAIAFALFITGIISFLFVLAPILAVTALAVNKNRVIAITTALLLAIMLASYFDRTFLDDVFGFELSKLNIVLAYLCLVIPTNLIVIVIERLRLSEARANEVSQLKSEFLSTMSHEIRTPLNAVMGLLQLIEMADVPDRQKKQAATGLAASRQLLTQLVNVLETSRIEANSIEITAEKTALVPIIEQWNETCQAFVERHDGALDVAVQVSPNVPSWAAVDRHRLTQIVDNLCDNAVKFTKNGQIQINVDFVNDALANGKTLIIDILDTGSGIPVENQQSVFERFSQLDSSHTRKNGGSGLGLSICKDLATLMGGSVTVNSPSLDPAFNTQFTIRIPISKWGNT